MTQSTLNAVAIDVVAQYGLAGKYLVEAYRVGTQRTVEQLNTRYAAIVNTPALPMVDASFKESLVAAHLQLTGFLVGGVARATQQADLAIDRMAESAADGIQRLASVGERVGSVVGTPVVETMTRVNMPMAQLSLQIANQVVAGSKQLVERVGTVEDVVAAATASASAATEPKARARRAA